MAHAPTIAGLLLALASTVLISLSYLREHGAVAGLPGLSLRRPVHSTMLLLTSRSWLIGFGMESSGFVLYVAALALAPLALVQSVAAGGVGILAVATAHFGHRRLSGRELVGVSFAVTGLALLAVSLSGGDARDTPGELGPIMLWLAVTTGVAMLVFTSGRTFLQRGVGDGIAGGLFFAAGDICTKVATEGGGRMLFVIPLIAGYLLGTSLLQVGYQMRRCPHRRRPGDTLHEHDPDRRGNDRAARATPGRNLRRPADRVVLRGNRRCDPARPARGGATFGTRLAAQQPYW